MSTEEIDKKLQDAYNKSEGLALIPVLKLIYLTTGIDLYKDYKLPYPLSSNKSKDLKTGEILINNKVKLYVTVVDDSYDLTESIKSTKLIETEINTFDDIEEKLKKELVQMISYLTHSCLIVFNNLKEKYKELIEYHLTMDNNTTIYLDYEKKKRLGVLFEDI